MKTARNLEAVLTGKDKYSVVFPKGTKKKVLVDFAFKYPVFTLYENTTDRGLLQIINQPEGTLL